VSGRELVVVPHVERLDGHVCRIVPPVNWEVMMSFEPAEVRAGKGRERSVVNHVGIPGS